MVRLLLLVFFPLYFLLPAPPPQPPHQHYPPPWLHFSKPIVIFSTLFCFSYAYSHITFHLSRVAALFSPFRHYHPCHHLHHHYHSHHHKHCLSLQHHHNLTSGRLFSTSSCDSYPHNHDLTSLFPTFVLLACWDTREERNTVKGEERKDRGEKIKARMRRGRKVRYNCKI